LERHKGLRAILSQPGNGEVKKSKDNRLAGVVRTRQKRKAAREFNFHGTIGII
jgi:hypothetical protein